MIPEDSSAPSREEAEQRGTAALQRSRSARLRGGTLADAAAQAQVARDAFEQAGSQLGAAIAIYEQAVIERLRRTDLSRAVDLQERALSRFRELSSSRWQSASLCELGTLDRTRRRPEHARRHLDRALRLAEELADDLLIANACLELATVERLVGHADLAVALAERAVHLYRPLASAGLPNALLELSKARMRLDPTSDAAAEPSREAFALYKARNHHLGAANAERQMGSLAVLRSDYVAAGRHLQSALGAYRQLEEPVGLGNVLPELARLHALAGDFTAAEGYLKEAADLHDRLGEYNRDPYAEGSLLREMAQMRRLLGDDAGAQDLLRQCLEKLRGTSDTAGQAHTRRALAELLVRRGHPRRARHEFHVALRLYEAMAEPHGVTTTQYQLGSLELRMGRQRSALRHLQIARDLADVHGGRLLQIRVRRLHARTLPPEQAVAELERLRQQAEFLESPLEVASIDVDLAVRLRGAGEARRALLAVCRAIDASQRIRGTLRLDLDRETFYAEWRDRHLLAMQLATELDDGHRALRVADTARGEGLSAAILAGPLAVGTQLAEPLAAVRLAPDARAESEALRVLEVATSPALRHFISPAREAGDARRIQPAIDVLLYELDERPRTPIVYCVWAAPRVSPRVFMTRLDRTGEATLAGLADGRRWRGGLLPESLRAALIPPPLSDAMRTGELRRLLVVPAGPLWSVPFGALQLDRQPLLRSAEIVYAPSLSASLSIRELSRDASSRPITYLREDLPGIELERDALTQGRCEVLGSSELASRLRESADCAFAAVSAHGDRTPGLGQALHLSDDVRLHCHEILGGRVAPIVVLGACWAARVDPVRGAEPLGLPTAFLTAGASVVIGAMHVVHSESTGAILAELYKALLQQAHPVHALRRAQLHCFDGAAGRLPLREWAGLIAVGRH